MPFLPAQKLDTLCLAGYFFHSYDKFTRVSPGTLCFEWKPF
jgi:hypothetical protein